MFKQTGNKINVGIFTISSNWIDGTLVISSSEESRDPYLGLPEAYKALLLRFPELTGRLMFSAIRPMSYKKRGVLQIVVDNDEAAQWRGPFELVLAKLVKQNKDFSGGLAQGTSNTSDTMTDSVISFSACYAEKAW